MERKEAPKNKSFGYCCRYCLRSFPSSQGIAGHQKAHRYDAGWQKGTHHGRIRLSRKGSRPRANPVMRTLKPRLVVPPNQVVPPPPFLPPRARPNQVVPPPPFLPPRARPNHVVPPPPFLPPRARPNQVVPPPPFLPPRPSMVRPIPIPFPFNVQLVKPGFFPLLANLPAASTTLKCYQPVRREMVPGPMLAQAFPSYQMVTGNSNRVSFQPAESQDSSATVIGERVRKYIKGKGVDVHQELKNDIERVRKYIQGKGVDAHQEPKNDIDLELRL